MGRSEGKGDDFIGKIANKIVTLPFGPRQPLPHYLIEDSGKKILTLFFTTFYGKDYHRNSERFHLTKPYISIETALFFVRNDLWWYVSITRMFFFFRKKWCFNEAPTWRKFSLRKSFFYRHEMCISILNTGFLTVTRFSSQEIAIVQTHMVKLESPKYEIESLGVQLSFIRGDPQIRSNSKWTSITFL